MWALSSKFESDCIVHPNRTGHLDLAVEASNDQDNQNLESMDIDYNNLDSAPQLMRPFDQMWALSPNLGSDCIVHPNYIGHIDLATVISNNHGSRKLESMDLDYNNRHNSPPHLAWYLVITRPISPEVGLTLGTDLEKEEAWHEIGGEELRVFSRCWRQR
ncbi:hypothetical protein HAX54_037376 [Datura stramonium]|uniref:Uncharacterized protein n=1 Tax=Datura stramonium TaxID=4076 RepID=A0ABS8SGW0_DATST|nr:hypothetical protein [Datura stramonium]